MSETAQTKPNAFTGHVIHAAPFSDSQKFQTPLYRKWSALRKSAPDTTPDWAEFQAQANRPKASTPAKSKPTPGQLSKRGQKLIEPRPYGSHYCTPIEPDGSGIARLARTKARI